MGIVQFDLRCPQCVNGIIADPQTDWSFDELISELNSIDQKLQASSPVPLHFTKTHSSDLPVADKSRKAFVMHVSDDESNDDDAYEDNNSRHVTIGNRFGCEDTYLSDSTESDSESTSEAQWALMDKGGVIEGALIELSHEHQLSVAEEIRARISAFGADLTNEKDKFTHALSRAEKNKEARRELDRKRDLQYQRQIAEELDNHLTDVQRHHEYKSQIEEKKIRDDAAIEEAKRKQKAFQEEKIRQEKIKAEEARHQAEKKKEEEAKAIALEAEKAAKEAAEMAAAESQRKAAEALTASQGVVSKESGSGRLNKAPEGNVLKGAESALKMEESRLQIYNEVVGKGFASEMDSNREYSRQGMQMARRIKTITGTKESVRVFSYGIVAPVGLRAAALMSPEAKPEQFAILVRDIPASSDGQSRKEQVDAYFKNIYPETFYKSLVVTENKKSTKSTKSWKTVKRSSDELSYTLTRKKSTPKKLYRLTTLAFLASLVKRWIRLNIISNEKIDGLTPKLEAAQKSTIREKQQGADVEFFTSRVTAGAAAQSAHARMIDTWTVMDAP